MRTTASTPETDCIQCGTRFKPKRGSVGKFCCMSCNHEHRKAEKINGIDSKYKCCICHALIGLGIRRSARLIKGSRGLISNRLKAVHVTRRTSQNEKICANEAQARAMNHLSDTMKTRQWHDAYLSEYYFQFTDWSCLWTYAKQNKRNKQKTIVRQQKRASLRDVSGLKEKKRRKYIVRGRLYNAVSLIKSKRKGNYRKSEKMLGCTLIQLQEHIQKQFSNGMTWNNHGKVWHVDHIIPLSKFNLFDASQYLLATHYTNLQPMWAKDNRVKSDKITQTHQLQFL